MASKQFTSTKRLRRARGLLTILVGLLEENNIKYHLEGGTLLGFVRDKEFLPWDHDIDLSIMSDDFDKMAPILEALRRYGYRTRILSDSEEFMSLPSESPRVIRVKPAIHSLLAKVIPFLNSTLLSADIFIKYNREGFTYWKAKGKVMRVSDRHYSGFDLVEYRGRFFHAPADHKNYLRAKYGNWHEPVKEWDCSVSERTIVG